MVVSPVVTLAVAAVGVAIVVNLIVREWRRANAEVASAKAAPVSRAQREAIPSLRRDPATGIYRPDH